MTDSTRLAALEAVAEAARNYVERRGKHYAWPDLIAALEALDALPAPTPGQESRKIAQMVTGRDADDVCLEYALCTDGTAWLLQWEDCKPIGWKQLPPIPAAGYAVVPREPTEAMRKAAFGPILHGGRGGPLTADYVRQEAALTVYRAMIDSLNAATDRDIERAASEPTR